MQCCCQTTSYYKIITVFLLRLNSLYVFPTSYWTSWITRNLNNMVTLFWNLIKELFSIHIRLSNNDSLLKFDAASFWSDTWIGWQAIPQSCPSKIKKESAYLSLGLISNLCVHLSTNSCCILLEKFWYSFLHYPITAAKHVYR